MAVIWFVITVASAIYLLIVDPSKVLLSMVDGSNEATALAIKLIANYGLWMGFFNMVDKTGVAESFTKLLHPVTAKLFPGISKESEKYVTMNISANLLGLGNMATPMGINAVCSLNSDDKANKEIKLLTVISATSLQLVPTTMLSLRATAGSSDVSGVLPACIVATVLSTTLGIIICKTIEKIKLKGKKTAKAENKTPTAFENGLKENNGNGMGKRI